MSIKRQLPNLKELRELMQFKKPELNPVKRRLDKALTIADLRAIAKRRTPKAPFDYTDGSAEGEISYARARQAFEDIEFHPEVLRPATEIDTSVEILGGPSALPFGTAPTGFARMMHTEVRLPVPALPEPPVFHLRFLRWARCPLKK